MVYENPLRVDNSHRLDDDLEYYAYADTKDERLRLAGEIRDEMAEEQRLAALRLVM